MKLKLLAVFVIVAGYFLYPNLSAFAGEAKIIVYGEGKDCDDALKEAKRICTEDKKGEVTFIGLCTEQKDKSAESRWKQDVYCKLPNTKETKN